MSKEIEVTNEAGEVVKEIVYSPEEYGALNTDLEKTKKDLIELKRINAERSQNFTAYSKMSAEEKAAFDANTTTLLKREESLTNQIAELTTKLTDKEKKENDSAKNHALTSIHHGDEAVKKTLEEKYALLTGMPETTPEEIAARSREAAKLAGIQIDPRNPLYANINGEAPAYKPNKEYVETPAGKQAVEMALGAMGIKPTNK